MLHARNERSPRRGFTLIELLVVMAILAVLAGLILSGVFAIFGKKPIIQARNEMTQFDGSIAQFKQEFGVEYIPSTFVLAETQYNMADPLHQKSVAFLRKVFGSGVVNASGTVGPNNSPAGIDWNGSGGAPSGTTQLTGEQCLVFFLGGIPSASGPQCLGFANNANNPAATAGKRYGPYFTFKSGRLTAGPGGYFTFRDPYERPSGATTSYAYFSSGFGGYSLNNGSVAEYYVDAAAKPINPNGYQILCAGQDGTFGSLRGTPGSWTGNGTSNPAGRDDQANFSRAAVLGAGQ